MDSKCLRDLEESLGECKYGVGDWEADLEAPLDLDTH